jgi:general secretion pathway protein L
VAGAAEQALAKALPEPPRVHLRASAQVMADAWALAQASGLDLAQFDMTVSGGAAPLQRLRRALQGVWAAPAWKPARAGLVLLVLVQLVGINLWAWHEKSAIAAKRAQAKALLQETFPRVTVVVDAPLQMQREVSALRSAAGAAQGDSVEALLTAFSPYVQAQQQLSAINYVAGELTLGGLQLTDAQLAKLQSGDAGVPLRVRSEAGRLVLSAAAGSALGAKP